MAIVYLGAKEVAERIGVQPITINNYKMPEPDVLIGRVRGWSPETIDRWNESRPGRGNWRSQQAETQE
ncbi:XRE family transcriptional regulator [Canibacter zhoujuaniae]|uniref:XRE family transcriptional regulator n=1 Tax=Canibacter zhoujuaniae TaxID=2708343 RepID=UPI00141F2654|nr:XRE family transcriptional regulator [Canibacter zhoujuaniae]